MGSVTKGCYLRYIRVETAREIRHASCAQAFLKPPIALSSGKCLTRSAQLKSQSFASLLKVKACLTHKRDVSFISACVHYVSCCFHVTCDSV